MNARASIRPAAAHDHTAYTTLQPLLGSGAPILDFDAWHEQFMPTSLVAIMDNRVVGYVYYQPLASVGYVRHLVIATTARRQGIGRALMLAVADALLACGCTHWELNVLPHEEPATKLYRSLGMRPVYKSTSLRLPWACVARLVPTGGINVSIIAPADDAHLEGMFKLGGGQLKDYRKRTGRLLLRADDPQTCMGVAVFDPAFPGAFPFRVQVLAARTLLDAMRVYARPDKDYVMLVIEDDLALREALVGVGAIARQELEHYAGSL